MKSRRVREALHREQRAARIVVGEALGGVEHQPGVGHPEDVHHVLELYLRPPVGDQLLERAESVAEGAGGGASEHADSGVGQLDLLVVGDPAQHAGDLLE